MSKKIQLNIADPCHENWDGMTPVEKGRFCGSCQKQVVDFSNMSDWEVAQFFKKPSTGSVCGRFMPDQLGRDMEIPKKRTPWLKYFFQFTMPLFLGSLKASANKTQGKIAVVQTDVVCMERTTGLIGPGQPQPADPGKIEGQVLNREGNPISFAIVRINGTRRKVVCDVSGRFSIRPKKKWKDVTLIASATGYLEVVIAIKKGTHTGVVIKMSAKNRFVRGEVSLGIIEDKPAEQFSPTTTITGAVTDENGDPVSQAAVMIKGTTIGTSTDKKGDFALALPSNLESATLTVSYIGYQTVERTLQKNEYDQSAVITMVMNDNRLKGEVFIVAASKKKPEAITKTTPLIPPLTYDAGFKNFKVFPNPVSSGTEMTIEWKKPEEGYYLLEIVNQSGQTVHQRELWVDAGARMLNLGVPSIAAGNYLIRITNRKSGKGYTEKIVIQ